MVKPRIGGLAGNSIFLPVNGHYGNRLIDWFSHYAKPGPAGLRVKQKQTVLAASRGACKP